MNDDPDLPGDKEFHPSVGGELIINTVFGPAWANADTLSTADQAAIHHNKLRYSELMKARMCMPNQYNETRYRT